MPERILCQGCQRMLVPLRDGTARRHVPYRGAEDYCRSVGYRLARWPVGQRLFHHTGDLWEITEDRGGQYGDYYMRCLRGREEGREKVAHGEYMHRHGWQPATSYNGAGAPSDA